MEAVNILGAEQGKVHKVLYIFLCIDKSITIVQSITQPQLMIYAPDSLLSLESRTREYLAVTSQIWT